MGSPRHLFRPIATSLLRDRAQGAGRSENPARIYRSQGTACVTPQAVEEAFIKANPGLSANAMAVGCDAKRLTEVRLCLSKDLHFRDCAQIAKRSCRREELTMPPMRGS